MELPFPFWMNDARRDRVRGVGAQHRGWGGWGGWGGAPVAALPFPPFPSWGRDDPSDDRRNSSAPAATMGAVCTDMCDGTDHDIPLGAKRCPLCRRPTWTKLVPDVGGRPGCVRCAERRKLVLESGKP
jgi:hypothetical protein